jgi:hypothetical protein
MNVGEPVTGTNIPANTTISSIDSSTQIRVSNPATGSAVLAFRRRPPPTILGNQRRACRS